MTLHVRVGEDDDIICHHTMVNHFGCDGSIDGQRGRSYTGVEGRRGGMFATPICAKKDLMQVYAGCRWLCPKWSVAIGTGYRWSVPGMIRFNRHRMFTSCARSDLVQSAQDINDLCPEWSVSIGTGCSWSVPGMTCYNRQRMSISVRGMICCYRGRMSISSCARNDLLQS